MEPTSQQKPALSGNLKLAQQLIDLFNSHQPDVARQFIAKDYEQHIIPFNQTYRGIDGYVQANRFWLNAFPDVRLDVENLIGSGDLVVVEAVGRGTHQGALEVPGGKLEATGKHVDLPICLVWQFRNGVLYRDRHYFDSSSLLQRIGAR